MEKRRYPCFEFSRCGGGNIVGHIICSKAEVRTAGSTTFVLNMGPISILPEYQRKGIGKALITSMIDRAKQLGYGAILFLAGRSIILNLDLKKLLCLESQIQKGITILPLWGWNWSRIIWFQHMVVSIMSPIFIMTSLTEKR